MYLPGLDFPLRTVREGLVEILVPAEEARAPRRAPVFYNPAMRLNRDIAVLCLRVFIKRSGRPARICEPLCGCGVRGIRFALEAQDVAEVVMGDLNPNAVLLAEENVRRNDVAHLVSVSRSDANVLLTSLSAPGGRCDLIDLDPFGSPSPFMDSAVRALRNGGLLALTATDMAPLCGVHKEACMRKYGGVPLRVGYCKELALRLLLGALARVAASHDMGIRPLLGHATDHYVRAYCIIERGQGKANKSVSELGYVLHCPSCLEREVRKGLAIPLEEECPSCGSRRQISGPLWAGGIFDPSFCRDLLGELGGTPWVGRRARKLLSTILEEAEGPPTYFPIHRICDALQTTTPPIDRLVEELRARGWFASRTHFDPQGIRTDAPARELVKLIQATV